MQTTPLLLPAPVARRCHLCDLDLTGKPMARTGFVIAGATGRAFCAFCVQGELPSRLRLDDVEENLAELHGAVHVLMEISEAAHHRPLVEMRGLLASVAADLSSIAENLTSAAVRCCAVCGCSQDDEGDWHWYLAGEDHTATRRTRVWLADDLCSACLGQHTSENTLAGQCDLCQEFSSRLSIRGVSRYAACPGCLQASARKKEAR